MQEGIMFAFWLKSTQQSTNLCPRSTLFNLGNRSLHNSLLFVYCRLLSLINQHTELSAASADSKALAVRPLNQLNTTRHGVMAEKAQVPKLLNRSLDRASVHQLLAGDVSVLKQL